LFLIAADEMRIKREAATKVTQQVQQQQQQESSSQVCEPKK
jgi:hypothetical protein